MLQEPFFDKEKLLHCLKQAYEINVTQLAFLPIGADANTAVYHINSDHADYFLKLRMGNFDETAVTVPKFLFDQGLHQIIPPQTNKAGQLWTTLDDTHLILYPFIEGKNGYETQMMPLHWQAFGNALAKLHTIRLPQPLRQQIRQEQYAPRARQLVTAFLAEDHLSFDQQIVREIAQFIKGKTAVWQDLIKQAEQLADVLLQNPPRFTLCHADLHAGNIFIGGEDNLLYLVDWDEIILAPKERDLMYIGGGLLNSGLSGKEEAQLFYGAYGTVGVNKTAVAYYRFERIIQDVSEYCLQLQDPNASEDDLKESLVYLKSNFNPKGTIERAYQAITI
jgi:spectinomycin phosphotransferase